MDAAGFEDVDPQAVEPQLAGQVQRTGIGESGDMAVQVADQIAKARIAHRQVVERGVGGIAAIAMRARPVAARAILCRQVATGIAKFAEQRWVAQLGLRKTGGEQGADSHPRRRACARASGKPSVDLTARRAKLRPIIGEDRAP